MTDPLRLPAMLSDGEIVLDGHTLADAEAHLAGEDAEMRRRFEAPGPATLEGTRAAMARWIEARAAGGPMFAYAVRGPGGVLVGGCEIRLLAADRANVSYWIFPAFRGRGYAGRALALLVEAAARLTFPRQLEAHIDADNTASRRVAEKAGFIESGMVEDAAGARVLYTRPARIEETP